MKSLKWLLCSLALVVPALSYTAQDGCRNRGDLDVSYCDENRDLVADWPKTPAKYRNPPTLSFMYTPVQDSTVMEKMFQPFTQYLAQCTGKSVHYLHIQSDAAEVEAMRSGQLHVAGFSSGTTVAAVNRAGAVPFAAKGHIDPYSKQPKYEGYNLAFIVKKNSPYKKLSDLKGKRVAHVSETSNSGNMAPIALLPKRGLTPGVDYKIVFSGKHEYSILGVSAGEYDGAPVASDVFLRMIANGQIKADDFRMLYVSPRFPTSSVAYAHDLEPALRDRIVKCFAEFQFPPEMQKTLGNSDRFVPITFQNDWNVIRVVVTASESMKKTQAEQKTLAKSKE